MTTILAQIGRGAKRTAYLDFFPELDTVAPVGQQAAYLHLNG